MPRQHVVEIDEAADGAGRSPEAAEAVPGDPAASDGSSAREHVGAADGPARAAGASDADDATGDDTGAAADAQATPDSGVDTSGPEHADVMDSDYAQMAGSELATTPSAQTDADAAARPDTDAKAGLDTAEEAEVASVATSDGGPEKAAGRTLRGRFRMPATRRDRVIAAVCVVVVLAGAGTLAWWRLTALPSDAAFRFDGQVTTVDQLDRRIDALRALYGVEQPQDPAKADGFRRDVAKSVALSDILDKAASDMQVVVADKQVNDTMDRYVEQQFGADGHNTFVKALGNVGTSENAVRDEIRRQLTVSALMTRVVGAITVTDSDVKTAYDQRRATLGTPEKRSLRNIVVKDQQTAQTVLDQLKAGTPIEKVASASSLDASTKDKGGALGDVARSEMEQPVADAAFGVPAGQLYGPVQGAHGWNVGRVDAITPFVPATFDQASAGLRQALQVERTLAVWRDWLGQQIRAAGVQYADAFRPADPDAAPSVDQPGSPALGGQPG